MIDQNSGRNTSDDQSADDMTNQKPDRSIPDEQSDRDIMNQNSGPSISDDQSDCDMAEHDPDWVPIDRAIAHVEKAQQCCREKAVNLVRQAADNLKLRSRTNPKPIWYNVDLGGQEIFFSDRGRGRVEICREDLLKLWPEQTDATNSHVVKTKPASTKQAPTQEKVGWAIEALWPEGIPLDLGATECDCQIHEWLVAQKMIRPETTLSSISRATQRLLAKRP
jgi:hypothetical protein